MIFSYRRATRQNLLGLGPEMVWGHCPSYMVGSRSKIRDQSKAGSSLGAIYPGTCLSSWTLHLAAPIISNESFRDPTYLAML